jgi:hypothetical protein
VQQQNTKATKPSKLTDSISACYNKQHCVTLVFRDKTGPRKMSRQSSDGTFPVHTLQMSVVNDVDANNWLLLITKVVIYLFICLQLLLFQTCAPTQISNEMIDVSLFLFTFMCAWACISSHHFA